jgi:hypothetical protein
MMKKSSARLQGVLDRLRTRARTHGLNDAQWAARAGIRKETLSRMRSRPSCDFATLQALAEVVDASLDVVERRHVEPDGLMPARVDREYEERLLELADSKDLSEDRWRAAGPDFFMAGLAVMLASATDRDRRALLALAERLHAGMSQVGVFALWLERSPVRPSRFLPMLASERHAA